MGIHFLISNDDGLHASGIAALAERCRALGRVTIVAPDKDRSGASNSLTLDAPVRIREIDDQTFEVTGTPTDCVHIAITGLLDSDPDIVLSGINAGANLGDDVIYSGTVAAASRFQDDAGMPADGRIDEALVEALADAAWAQAAEPEQEEVTDAGN